MKDTSTNAIQKYRQGLSLTQKQLAERVGIAERNLQNWESGKTKPGAENLIKLAKIFGIPAEQLLEEINNTEK